MSLPQLRFWVLRCFICIVTPSVALAEESSLLSAYGFLKFSYTGSARAMNSFGFANLSAPVSVHPDPIHADHYRGSFQVQQSRIGTWIKKGSPIQGQLEFDFIRFDLASPSTGSMPRLRIAKVAYTPHLNHEFTLGQDWDIFNQVKPFSYNRVGLYYQSGNVGFMRQQAKWKAQVSDEFTITTAIGLPGKNETSTDGDLEIGAVPTLATTLNYKWAEDSHAGIALIGSELLFSSGETKIYRPMYGANLYGKWKSSENLEFTGHIFYGQNLANTGTLSLSRGTFNESIHEWGGFSSFNLRIWTNFKAFGGIGFNQVIEPSGSSLSFLSPYRTQGNKKFALGLTYEISTQSSFFMEDAQYWSSYVDSAGANPFVVSSNALEVGIFMEF